MKPTHASKERPETPEIGRDYVITVAENAEVAETGDRSLCDYC